MKPAWKFLALLLVCPLLITAQTDLGWDGQPEDSDQIAPLGYYGDTGEVSGGFQIGDTVPDFTVYDFDGNSLNLYEKLSGDKPVMLVNGSISCLRFRNTFDPQINEQAYMASRNFILSHQDDIEWIFIYGIEAHPTDGNCPSNCPPTISTDTTVLQPITYLERRWSSRNWEVAQEYEFPFTMYSDNPDNSIYDNFFERAFGNLLINCEGIVEMRGDWAMTHIAQNTQEISSYIENWNSCTPAWEDDGEGEGEVDDTDPLNDPDNDLQDPGETVGINDLNAAGINLYPNPANQSFTLNNLPVNSVLTICDLSGREVESMQVWDSTMQFDALNFTEGYYIVNVQTANISVQKKLLIQH